MCSFVFVCVFDSCILCVKLCLYVNVYVYCVCMLMFICTFVCVGIMIGHVDLYVCAFWVVEEVIPLPIWWVLVGIATSIGLALGK